MDKIRKLVCSTNIDDVLLAYVLVQDTDKFHEYFKVNPHTDNVVYPKFSDNQIFVQRAISLNRRKWLSHYISDTLVREEIEYVNYKKFKL